MSLRDREFLLVCPSSTNKYVLSSIKYSQGDSCVLGTMEATAELLKSLDPKKEPGKGKEGKERAWPYTSLYWVFCQHFPTRCRQLSLIFRLALWSWYSQPSWTQRKLWFRDIRWPAQWHRAGKWPSCDLKPDPPDTKMDAQVRTKQSMEQSALSVVHLERSISTWGPEIRTRLVCAEDWEESGLGSF